MLCACQTFNSLKLLLNIIQLQFQLLLLLRYQLL